MKTVRHTYLSLAFVVCLVSSATAGEYGMEGIETVGVDIFAAKNNVDGGIVSGFELPGERQLKDAFVLKLRQNGLIVIQEGRTKSILYLNIFLIDAGDNNTTITVEVVLRQWSEVVRNRKRVMATTWMRSNTCVVSNSELLHALNFYTEASADKFLSEWLAANPRR